MAEQGAGEKTGDPAAEEERLRPGRRVIGIHQPAFMPWLGYFDKMDRVDVFVFLDTVQFAKNDWQNRNRILLDGAPHWLTVPVRFSFGDRIVDVATGKMNKGDWREKHLALLRHAYCKAPYLEWLWPMLQELYAPDLPRLVDWTLRSTMLLARLLGIPAENVIFAQTVRHGSFAQLPPFYDIVDSIVWDVKPDMVYTHYDCDTHQEHRAVSQVVQAVCRPTWITSIMFFEGVTSLDFQPNHWNPLTAEAYQAKMDALHLHRSQVERWVRGGLRLQQVVAALSCFRGSQVGCQAAESFVVFRQIGIAIPQPEVVADVGTSASPAVPLRKNGSEAHDYTQIRNTVLRS